MARISDVDPNAVEPRIRAVFEAQRKRYGAPLLNHLIYARRPSIFHGARAMWSGHTSGGDQRLAEELSAPDSEQGGRGEVRL